MLFLLFFYLIYVSSMTVSLLFSFVVKYFINIAREFCSFSLQALFLYIKVFCSLTCVNKMYVNIGFMFKATRKKIAE